MACKHKILAILIMAFTIMTILPAQNFDNDACYMVETDEGMEYIQRFEWEPIEYIQKFVFHLERQITGEKTKDTAAEPLWEEIECIETLDNAIDMPLDSGVYRYKIVVYNLLGQAELESEWIPMEIVKVYQPEVQSISPSLIYLEEPQTGIFTLSGKGLLNGSSLAITGPEGLYIPVDVLEADEKHKELKFYVDPTLLLTGDYSLTVDNEGGLGTEFSPITVKFKKPYDIDVSAGYTCLINMFDSTFKDFFGSRLFPLSGSFKVSVMPIKHDFGYLGLGLNGTYAMLQNGDYSNITEGYMMSGNLISGYLNFVYQFPFRKESNNKLMAILEVHAGAGLVMLHNVTFHFPHNITTDPFNVMYLSAQGGGSAQYYFTNRLYAEFNCDFTFSPSVDLTMGNLVPSFMIGWQF